MPSKTFKKRKLILHMVLLFTLGIGLDLAIRSPVKLRFDLADLPNFVKIETSNNQKPSNQNAQAANSDQASIINSQPAENSNPSSSSNPQSTSSVPSNDSTQSTSSITDQTSFDEEQPLPPLEPITTVDPLGPVLPTTQAMPNIFNISNLSPNNQMLNVYQIQLAPNQSSFTINNLSNRSLSLDIEGGRYNILGNSSLEILAPSTIFNISCRCTLDVI
ncbi:hypothetical protein KC853_01640 [Candidatus Saccharibacteria bacterium]|nr:hypothetical protein [Candidatus Saccharibacteria bacterium]